MIFKFREKLISQIQYIYLTFISPSIDPSIFKILFPQ